MVRQKKPIVMWSGGGSSSVCQDYDLTMLSHLLDDLAGLIDTNEDETDLMCGIADSLKVEPEKVIQDDQGRVEGEGEATGEGTGNSLEEENQQLIRLVEEQLVRNESLSQLLTMSRLSLQTSLDSLRGFVESKSYEIIELHKESLDKINEQRSKNLELMLANSQLENTLFFLTRSLGLVLNKSINYVDRTKSVDYLESMYATTRQLE